MTPSAKVYTCKDHGTVEAYRWKGTSRCIVCKRLASRLWANLHRDRLKAATDKYRLAHPERVREAARASYAKNKGFWNHQRRERRRLQREATSQSTPTSTPQEL